MTKIFVVWTRTHTNAKNLTLYILKVKLSISILQKTKKLNIMTI